MSTKTRPEESPLKTSYEQAKQRIPPQRYNELLDCIALEDIRLLDVKAKLHEGGSKGEITLSFLEETSTKSLGEERAELLVVYQLKGKSGRKNALNVLATYKVVFGLSCEIPAEFFEIYNRLSLPLQTFPYFREFMNTLISRMGLPQLVLPLRTHLVGKSD